MHCGGGGTLGCLPTDKLCECKLQLHVNAESIPDTLNGAVSFVWFAGFRNYC